MRVRARTVSTPVLGLIEGPLRAGLVLGRHHVAFGDYVLSLTPPGGPRMPNGVEVDVEAEPDQEASIGDGRIAVGGLLIEPGQPWDPVPSDVLPGLPPGPPEIISNLAGRGPGLTPAGDDLIAGYAAGLTLLHGRQREATELVGRASALTTLLSATLMMHAARGEVPEPVHSFLHANDEKALRSFGHTSGTYWLVGLRHAGARYSDARA